MNTEKFASKRALPTGLKGLDSAYVETVSACDLDCLFCPRVKHKSLRGSRLMDDAILDRLVATLIDVRSVSLNGLGEPLLDRRLPDVVRRLGHNGVETKLTTNGTLLASAGIELMEAGISLIALSLDGATNTTQAALRDGTSLERLLELFTGFAERRNQMNAPTRLAITTVLSRENIAELCRLVERSARAGADTMLVKNLTFTTISVSAASSFVAKQSTESAIIEQALVIAASLGITLTINHNPCHPAGPAPWHCPYHPLSTVFVSVEGLVFPCFVEGERWMAEGGKIQSERVIGNLNENDLGTAWSSHAASRFRAAFAAGSNPACRTCVLLGEEYRRAGPGPAASPANRN